MIQAGRESDHQFQDFFADVEDLLASFTDHLVRQEI